MQVLRRWPVIVLLLAVGAVVGVLVGRSVTPTYEAQARLTVGPSGPDAQTLSAALDATTDLAGVYADIALSRTSLEAIARQSGLSTTQLAARLQVVPVSQSPLLLVTTTGDSERDAVALGRASVRQITRIVGRLTSSTTAEARQLRAYRRASLDAITARAEVRRLRARRTDGVGEVSLDDLQDAQADAEAAELELSVAGDTYTKTRQNLSGTAELSVFDAPRATGDDHVTVLARIGFVGAVVGAALGIAVALALALLRRRRLRVR